MVPWAWISYFGCDLFEVKIVGFLRHLFRVYTFADLGLIPVCSVIYPFHTEVVILHFHLNLGGGVMGASGFIAAQTVLANK